MQTLQEAVLNLAVIVITGVVGVVARQVTIYFRQKGILKEIEAKKEVIAIVVHAVEQIYSSLNGPQKLIEAKKAALELLNKNNIKISEEELNSIIEATVKSINDNVKEVKQEQATTQD